MLLSNVTNGLAEYCAIIIATRPERLTWQGRAGSALRPLVSAVLVCGVRTEIPRFFYVAEIAAAKMLLFFRESVEVVILAVRVDKAVRYVSGQGYQCTRYPPAGSP